MPRGETDMEEARGEWMDTAPSAGKPAPPATRLTAQNLLASQRTVLPPFLGGIFVQAFHTHGRFPWKVYFCEHANKSPGVFHDKQVDDCHREFWRCVYTYFKENPISSLPPCSVWASDLKPPDSPHRVPFAHGSCERLWDTISRLRDNQSLVRVRCRIQTLIKRWLFLGFPQNT